MICNNIWGIVLISLWSLGDSKKRKSNRQTITVQENDIMEYVFMGGIVLLLLGALIYLLKRREQLLRNEKLRSIKRVL